MILLYVDDDLEDIELFCDAVQVVCPQSVCQSAENGKEGLIALKKIVPDYIFLDINMPVMGGIETLASIRADSNLCRIPVCMLSTTNNVTEIKTCLDMGAYRFFVKPNSFTLLCSMLQEFFLSEYASK